MVVRKVPDRLGVMTYLFQLQAYFTREQQSGSMTEDAVDDVDSVLAIESDDDMRQFADTTSNACHGPMQESSVIYHKNNLFPKSHQVHSLVKQAFDYYHLQLNTTTCAFSLNCCQT